MDTDSTYRSYVYLLLGAIMWCVMIVAAPLLAHLHHNISSGLIYFFFSKICHQMPDRSFSIFGKQLAVCSRCSGLYFGFLAGSLSYPLFHSMKIKQIPDRKLLLLSGVPVALDIGLNITGFWQNTEFTRLFTGFILGFTASWYAVPGFCNIRWKKLGS